MEPMKLNTRQNGSVRGVIFQENGEWFGAALEFNIVETGSSPQEVSMLLDEAVLGYIHAAQKNKIAIGVLNQEVDPQYEALWQAGNSGEGAEERGVYRAYSQTVPAFV